MKNANRVLALLFIFLIAVGLTSCSSGSSTAMSAGPRGNVFVLGTDAPITLPSVVDFNVMVTGVTLSDGTTAANLLTAPQTVDFSRLVGVRSLLDLNSVPAGTYTKATVTLASPVISFLDTSVPSVPPKISTMNGTLTQSSVTITFPQPLTLSQNGVVGLLIDFRLADSIQVVNGMVTGIVNPMLTIKAIATGTRQADIDDLSGGVVSVNAAAGTFVIQTGRGKQITVVTNGQTEFEDGASLASLTTNTIVEVSGSLDPATLNLTAKEIEVVSTDGFFLEGLITDVRPSSGPATAIDVLVRREIGASSIPLGQITTLTLNGTETYKVRVFGLSFSTFAFDNGNLVRGQQVAIGGTVGSSLTVHRIVLEPQGQIGTWVPGSTNIIVGNLGSFQFNDDSLAGVLFNNPVKVFTFNITDFEGLSGLSALTGTQPITLKVKGLVLLDKSTGHAVILAGLVETPDSD
jgi:hypothetical protein